MPPVSCCVNLREKKYGQTLSVNTEITDPFRMKAE